MSAITKNMMQTEQCCLNGLFIGLIIREQLQLEYGKLQRGLCGVSKIC